MMKKLTLRLDQNDIEHAKQYARREGKSVSRLVADYFALLESDSALVGTETTPRVAAPVGVLRGATVDDDDCRRYLEWRYR